MTHETRCLTIKLKPNSRERLREWADMLNGRRQECLQTLLEEGVSIESVFLDIRPDGDYLIYYMQAENLTKAAAIGRNSTHDIDAYHKKFKADCWESCITTELLLDLKINR